MNEKELKCKLIKMVITAEITNLIFENVADVSLDLQLNRIVEKYLQFETHVYEVTFEDGILKFKTMFYIDNSEVHVSWTVEIKNEISIT